MGLEVLVDGVKYVPECEEGHVPPEPTFKVGDFVKITDSQGLNTARCGGYGKVIDTADIVFGDYIGVEFAVKVGGHTCKNLTKDGHGWNFLPRHLIKVD